MLDSRTDLAWCDLDKLYRNVVCREEQDRPSVILSVQF